MPNGGAEREMEGDLLFTVEVWHYDGDSGRVCRMKGIAWRE